MKARLRGVYAITSAAVCASDAQLFAAVTAALDGGAALIQYRDKTASEPARHRRAARLHALCQAHAVPLIVNDSIALAAAVGADGVHLGANDGAIAAARATLGPEVIIGRSCGPSLARAHAAQAEGADYLAFGRYYPSATKPSAPAAAIEDLRVAARELQRPICAIGGIRPDNAAPLIAAGAAMIAAVEGIFAAADIAAATRAYARLFETDR